MGVEVSCFVLRVCCITSLQIKGGHHLASKFMTGNLVSDVCHQVHAVAGQPKITAMHYMYNVLQPNRS